MGTGINLLGCSTDLEIGLALRRQVAACTSEGGAMRKIRFGGDHMPRFFAVFLSAVVFALQLSPQTIWTDDPNFLVTTIEGPVEGSVTTTAAGDGTTWVLAKHELLRVDSKDNRLVSARAGE